ncbi:carbohydrate kinase family protein [Neobittarella massiliensis]|uniref:carbohydrate kinase family protein n=1 Tax=Neobittarella massiliensis (ex Bilen et al. 2018) TaxID=2041842 RepID=UPI000CF6AB52|nr:carbohydrate kinase family protein [Neobittarella massiliensis]
MFDTMIVNNPQVDLITPFEGTFPIVAGPTRIVESVTPEAGGCGNTMLAGSRLGLSCMPFGGIGNDLFGEFILDVYRAEGICTDAITVLPGTETCKVVVLVDGEGRHVLASMIGGYLGDMDLLDKWIGEVRSIYFTGYLLATEMMRDDMLKVLYRAAAMGREIFFDPGPMIPQIDRGVLEKCMSTATVVSLNDEEAALITGENTAERAAPLLQCRYGGVAIVKDGPKGCCIATPEDTAGTRYRGFSVPLVDTTAAGDAFLGAFMFAYLHGWALCDCAALANATGAAAVAKMGSGTHVPTKSEVLRVLQSANIMYDL